MGAYVSALFAQFTSPSVSNTTTEALNTVSLNDKNKINKIDIVDDTTSDQSNLNYNSPSPSEVSLISKHNDTDDEIINESYNKCIDNNDEKEKEKEFVNYGLLNYQKIRNEWTKCNDNKDEDEKNEIENNDIWERMIIDDEEQEEIINCIVEEKPFPYNVPLETMMEIMNKIWKHEKLMGYEITSKHHANHAMALDQL